MVDPRSAGAPGRFSDEVIAILSDRLSLLSHPTRIRILDELRDGERIVQALADASVTTQQNISGHLRLLRAAGVVSRRPVGREAYYAVSDASVYEVWERMLAATRKRVA